MLEKIYSAFDYVMRKVFDNARIRRISILVLFCIYFSPFIFAVPNDWLLIFPPFGLLGFGLLMVDMNIYLTSKGE